MTKKQWHLKVELSLFLLFKKKFKKISMINWSGIQKRTKKALINFLLSLYSYFCFFHSHFQFFFIFPCWLLGQRWEWKATKREGALHSEAHRQGNDVASFPVRTRLCSTFRKRIPLIREHHLTRQCSTGSLPRSFFHSLSFLHFLFFSLFFTSL